MPVGHVFVRNLGRHVEHDDAALALAKGERERRSVRAAKLRGDMNVASRKRQARVDNHAGRGREPSPSDLWQGFRPKV